MDKNLRVQKIYDKTDGYCHICHSKLSFANYGNHGTKGAWHIEHSVPKAKGGSDHLNNLYPACITCNLDKGTQHTKTARRQNGTTRAPFSKAKKERIKNGNTTAGVIIGGILGATVGPLGAIVGATVGGYIGNINSPKK